MFHLCYRVHQNIENLLVIFCALGIDSIIISKFKFCLLSLQWRRRCLPFIIRADFWHLDYFRKWCRYIPLEHIVILWKFDGRLFCAVQKKIFLLFMLTSQDFWAILGLKSAHFIFNSFQRLLLSNLSLRLNILTIINFFRHFCIYCFTHITNTFIMFQFNLPITNITNI